jgi:hypothetical protein
LLTPLLLLLLLLLLLQLLVISLPACFCQAFLLMRMRRAALSEL